MSNRSTATGYLFVPGALLALPTIVALPGGVHAGLAVVDTLCRGLVNRDCPLVITLLGALLYGVLLGFVAPVIVLGTLGYTLLRLGDGRLVRWFETAPRVARVSVWVLVLAVGLPGSLMISIMAYGLPIMVLTSLK